MPLITGLDHVVVAVRDLDAAIAAYETLLSRPATQRRAADGVDSALVVTDNVAVELMAPVGEGEGARRLRAVLDDGEGLKSLVFAVADIERMRGRAERVGLAPTPIKCGADGRRSFRADATRANGLRLFFVERAGPFTVEPAAPGGVVGLDHIVVRSALPESAAALFGARLALDMRLDREVMGRRLLFFRCGDSVVEIACDAASEPVQDRLWGLSWRVADCDAARSRLAATQLDVSDVRAGAKPGTRVFTVRTGTCGVPTLLLEPSSQRS